MQTTSILVQNALHLPKEIRRVSDVHWLISYLYDVDRVSFHPDDSFQDIVYKSDDKSNLPYYSPQEADNMDRLMEEAIDVCQSANVCIYSLCILAYRLRFMELFV